MQKRWARRLGPLTAVFVMAIQALSAASVVQMNLDELVDRSGQIFRGTVLDAVEGKLPLGGGELPTITYVLRVDEAFRGEFSPVKGEMLVELRMLGKVAPVEVDGAQRVTRIPEPPRMEVGRSYLLFATAPGPAGLTAPVGLGQGCFEIHGADGKELAVNAYDNVGLFEGMRERESVPPGPVPYARVAAAIRARLGSR